MYTGNVKILGSRVTSINVDIAHREQEGFKMNVGCKAKFIKPQNAENKAVLVVLEQTVYTPDDDLLSIKMISNVFIQLDEIPEEFDQETQRAILPVIQDRMFGVMDTIIANMGFRPLGLSKSKPIPVSHNMNKPEVTPQGMAASGDASNTELA